MLNYLLKNFISEKLYQVLQLKTQKQNETVCPIMYNHLTKEQKSFEDCASTLRPKYAATSSQLVETFPSIQ